MRYKKLFDAKKLVAIDQELRSLCGEGVSPVGTPIENDEKEVSPLGTP